MQIVFSNICAQKHSTISMYEFEGTVTPVNIPTEPQKGNNDFGRD